MSRCKPSSAALEAEVKRLSAQNSRNEQVVSELKNNIARLENKIHDVENQLPSSESSSYEIPMAVVQDVFDGECKEELESIYTTTVWSEIEDSLKDKLIDMLKKSLLVNDIPVAPHKELVKRLRNFYSNRRSAWMTKANPEKKQKRRLEMKASRLTYLAREKAVQEAARVGRVDLTNSDEVYKYRKSIPKVNVGSISPPYNSEDEELVQRRLEKRVWHLEKARRAKTLKRKNSGKSSRSLRQHTRHHTARRHQIISSSSEEDSPSQSMLQKKSFSYNLSVEESPLESFSTNSKYDDSEILAFDSCGDAQNSKSRYGRFCDLDYDGDETRLS